MVSRYSKEEVLVIPRELFDRLGSFQGLNSDVGRYLESILDPANNYFLSRDQAEHDPSHKQIISYAIFRNQNKVLRYTRSKQTGEHRLATKASLGIGGHINREDVQAGSVGMDTYMAGVEREIAEELRITSKWTQRIVALLNDDSNEVGQVHLAVVHLVDLENEGVTANEETLVDLAFLTLPELRAERARLETWSQHCVDGLEAWL